MRRMTVERARTRHSLNKKLSCRRDSVRRLTLRHSKSWTLATIESPYASSY